MCAQYIILGACVVGAVIVSLCAAWGVRLGRWLSRRIVRAAQAEADRIIREAREALPEELERLRSIARGAERLVRDLRQR